MVAMAQADSPPPAHTARYPVISVARDMMHKEEMAGICANLELMDAEDICDWLKNKSGKPFETPCTVSY